MNYTQIKVTIATALAITSTEATQAALSISPGDLLLGFYQVNSAGTGVEANTLVLDLGTASHFRESYTSMSLGNISADLTTAFGASWSTNSSIRWGIVGVVGASDSLVNGDPARTVYYSKDWNGMIHGSSGVTFSSTQMGTLATQIKTYSVAMDGAPNNGAGSATGAIVASSSPSNFSSFNPPTATTYFGVGQSPLGALGDSVEGLDMYRALFSVTASGVDLTAAASPGEALLRAQQYIGSITLASSGELNFVTPVPEPGTLTSFVASFLVLLRRKSRQS